MCDIGGIVKKAAPVALSIGLGPAGLGLSPVLAGAIGGGFGGAIGGGGVGGILKGAAFGGAASGIGHYVGSQLFPDFSLGSFFEGTPGAGMSGLPGAEGVAGVGSSLASGGGTSAASSGGFFGDAFGGGDSFFPDFTSGFDGAGDIGGTGFAANDGISFNTPVTTESLAPIPGASGGAAETLAPLGLTDTAQTSFINESNALNLEGGSAGTGGSTVPISQPGFSNQAQLNDAIPGLNTGAAQPGGVSSGNVQPLPNPQSPQLGNGSIPIAKGPVADILDSLGVDTTSGVGQFIAKNPISILAALGLGTAALTPEPQSLGELRDLARQTAGQGQALSNYLQSGTLPPGAQESVDEGKRAAIAAVRGKYSNLGLSGSTMETDAINSVESRAQQQAFGFAAQLLDAGIRSTGLSSNIYNYLINAEQTDDQAFAQALGAFTGSLAPNPQPAGA